MYDKYFHPREWNPSACLLPDRPRENEVWLTNLCLFPPMSHLQCHGLWDEDDPKEKKEPSRQSESEDESKSKDESDKESAPASSLISERRGSNHTLRSINFGTSIDSGHVQLHCAQQQTYQRRKSSSGGSHISHRSLHSSARSKRGGDPPLLSVSCSWLSQSVQNMRQNGESQQPTTLTSVCDLFIYFLHTNMYVNLSMLR